MTRIALKSFPSNAILTCTFHIWHDSTTIIMGYTWQWSMLSYHSPMAKPLCARRNGEWIPKNCIDYLSLYRFVLCMNRSFEPYQINLIKLCIFFKSFMGLNKNETYIYKSPYEVIVLTMNHDDLPFDWGIHCLLIISLVASKSDLHMVSKKEKKKKKKKRDLLLY